MISKSLFLSHSFSVIYNIDIDERGVLMKNTIVENGQTKLLTPQQRKWLNIWKHREFYMFCLPGIIAAIIFQYVPMYGALMAFKKVGLGQTLETGTWLGLQNFEKLFKLRSFIPYLKNTLWLNLWVIIVSIPVPLLLAVMLNNSPSKGMKSAAQTCTYLPYMLSMVVIASLIRTFCANSYGLINVLLEKMGQSRIKFLEESGWFVPLYVISAIWQSCGYNAIVYLAALTSIDPSVTEAATIDGASKIQRMWYIDLKLIMPTIVTMLLLRLGQIMGLSSMEKVLLLQTPGNKEVSTTLPLYIYQVGIQQAQYGFATAVSMFNTAANLTLLFTSNWISRKLANTSLF